MLCLMNAVIDTDTLVTAGPEVKMRLTPICTPRSMFIIQLRQKLPFSHPGIGGFPPLAGG